MHDINRSNGHAMHVYTQCKSDCFCVVVVDGGRALLSTSHGRLVLFNMLLNCQEVLSSNSGPGCHCMFSTQQAALSTTVLTSRFPM
jgi:hypothetical protein